MEDNSLPLVILTARHYASCRDQIAYRNHFIHRCEPPSYLVQQWHWIDSRRRRHLRYALRHAIVADDTACNDSLVRIASVSRSLPSFRYRTILRERENRLSIYWLVQDLW